jgi:hypothetical protein
VYFAHALARREDADTRRKLAALELRGATRVPVPRLPQMLLRFEDEVYCLAKPSHHESAEALVYRIDVGGAGGAAGERGGGGVGGPVRAGEPYRLGRLGFVLWNPGAIGFTRGGRLACFVDDQGKSIRRHDRATGALISAEPLPALPYHGTKHCAQGRGPRDLVFATGQPGSVGVWLVRVPDDGPCAGSELPGLQLVDARSGEQPIAWLADDVLLLGTVNGFALVRAPFGEAPEVREVEVANASGPVGVAGFLVDARAGAGAGAGEGADGGRVLLLGKDGVVRAWRVGSGAEAGAAGALAGALDRAALDAGISWGAAVLVDLGDRVGVGGPMESAIVRRDLSAVEARLQQGVLAGLALADGRLLALDAQARAGSPAALTLIDRRILVAGGADLVREVEAAAGLTLDGLEVVPRR